MSDRHVHITAYLYDDERAVERFIDAARALGFFREVVPIRLSQGADRIRAVAFFSKDLDGISDELEMPDVAERLSGILAYDVMIVSAWDGVPYNEDPPFGHKREHAWLVKGRGRFVSGEVVRDPRELAP